MRKIIFSAFFILACLSVSCQYTFAQRAITGKVVDKKDVPVVGASVVVKGTTNGTVTDKSGKFSITADDAATLVVNYGSEALEVPASGSNLVVKFKSSMKDLQKKLDKANGTKKKKK